MTQTATQKEAEAFMRASPFAEHLTKREWYAGMAMKGILANDALSRWPDLSFLETSLAAINAADALILELSRRPSDAA